MLEFTNLEIYQTMHIIHTHIFSPCKHKCFSGKRGILKGSSGLQIAYLSGKENSESGDVHFTKDDILALSQPLLSNTKFQGIDILLTSQWPKGIEKYGSVPVSDKSCLF